MSDPDRNENLVAYCGLYCGDCHGYQQKIQDLARDLRKELRQTKYKNFADFMAEQKFGEVFKDYDKCYEVLGSMIKYRCHKGCRSGGGNPFCAIRKCCVKNKYTGCWECAEFESCSKLDYLRPVHEDGHIKNLRMINKNGTAEFIQKKRYW